MKKINYLFICILILSTSVLKAQYGIGTDNPNPSAVLDITSTNGGVLISRMTSAQRDAIASPANGLLIFNTANNGFEVFKTSCSCWVGVNDNGNTPASSLVNTAPTAGSLNYTGNFIQGQSATVIYTYADSQSDVEGATTFVWQRASLSSGSDAATISGATSASYTFQAADLGLFVRAIVNPRAVTGVLNGVPTIGGWFQVEASTIPKANSLTVSGSTAVGSILTANYTFNGGNGTEDTTPVTATSALFGTTYTWQFATTNTGIGTTTASLYGALAFTKTYTPQNDLLGRYIRVGVKAKDTNGLQATNFVYGPWVGPITSSVEAAPTAINVSYSPTPGDGLVHTGSYTFFDTNNDPEAISTFKWYRASTSSGTDATAIAGATSITYTGQTADIGTYLGFGVTPKSSTGTSTGTEVIYYNPAITVPKATFTITASAIKQLPYFHQNRNMNTQNSIQLEINVTIAGGINFSSTTVNGYYFSGFIIVNTTGIQYITLTASGVQTAFNASGDNFTITGVGQSTETKAINISNTRTGTNLTSHFNGIISGISPDPTLATYNSGETFNNNGTCQNSPISTGYNSTTCTGSITIEGTSYSLVLINGQCWFNRNLKATPSNYSSYTTTSWLATSVGDLGYWGYYNSVTTSGTAGWASAESVANIGMLYQWSAAMNGANYERAQGVCPTGFHIPSDCEYMYLEHGLGMSIANQILATGFRANSTNNEGSIGNKIKSTPVSGYAYTGFNVIATGNRSNAGVFGNNGNAYFLTSTIQSIGFTYNRRFGFFLGTARGTSFVSEALPVRCLRD